MSGDPIPSSYEEWQRQLKASAADEGGAVKILKAPSDGSGRGHGQLASVADTLVRLAKDTELFHTPIGEPYATIEVEGHAETHPLARQGFRSWLARNYHAETGKVPHAQSMKDAISVLEGRALYEGEMHEVYVRIARFPDRIILDLGDGGWRSVEVRPKGWRVLERAPIKFRRPTGMLSLPEPVRGGDLNRLRAFINVEQEAWPLLVGWLACTLGPGGPFPVLVLVAEAGAGKSTTARVLRALIDPSTAPLRSEPRDSRDLMIAASNGAIVMLDNLSRVSRGLSDDLARLATGGGLSTRQLYTNAEETIFDAMRPVLLTGIEDLADRGDLLDRSMLVTCPAFPPGRRSTELALWTAFEAERPRLLGALLDAMAFGLRTYRTVEVPELPRMADAAVWITACEPALGLERGTFARAYAANRASAHEVVLDASPVPGALRQLLKDTGGLWQGTATALAVELDRCAGDAVKRLRAWPKGAARVGNDLRRLAPDLRATGIHVTFERAGHDRRRVIRIEMQRSVLADRTVRDDRHDHQARELDAERTADNALSPPSAPPTVCGAMSRMRSRVSADSADDADGGMRLTSAGSSHLARALDDAPPYSDSDVEAILASVASSERNSS